jgi:maleylacetate reductase
LRFEQDLREGFVHEQLPGRVVFRSGALAELPAEFDALGVGRALLIANGSAASTAARVSTLLGDRVVERLPNARQHVPAEDAFRAVKAARASDADGLVAVGGGSAVGLAKAVALETSRPVIAVPTTYAGSEMTPVYGITERGRKRTGRDQRVLPRIVIYDPAETVSLPKTATAGTGMNALAHCVEALYAQSPSPVSSLFAEEAIAALRTGLAGSIESPADLEARAAALYGAYLAGAVIAVTGMALHHRLCHVLGGTFELAHGDVNAVLLPYVATFNQPAAPAALSRVARLLDGDDAGEALFDLARSLGAPASLAELGMDRAGLARAAHIAVENGGYNPRPASVEEVSELLQRAHEGVRPGGSAS